MTIEKTVLKTSGHGSSKGGERGMRPGKIFLAGENIACF